MRLRQIVPFRDGSGPPAVRAWPSTFSSTRARLAECGDRPRRVPAGAPSRPSPVALLSQRLAPGYDPLSEGLQEFRLLAGFSQVREAMSFDSWSGQLDRYALLMVSLPQRLDELLTRGAEEDARLASPREGRAPRRAESSHPVLAAALMVMAALALLLHYFVQAGALAGQGEKVSATLFLVVGGFLLWALGRTR